MHNFEHPSYKKLALKLDDLPQEYPATQSGVELKILAKLFSPEEAEIASHLTFDAESPASIAEKCRQDNRKVKITLRDLLKRGLIEWEKGKGGFHYKIMPFVVGFYERQAGNIDSEFAQLFEEYYHEALHKSLTRDPSAHRVITVEKAIPTAVEVMPFEKASHYLESANSWGVLKCICRVQQKLIGKGCEHSVDNCMVLSSKENAFSHIEGITPLSKEEAYQVLRKSQEEGLVHTTANSQQDITYICNCCTCSCGFLRAVKEYGNAHPVAFSHFYAQVDEDMCSGCGECLNSCQFNALRIQDNGIMQVDRESCVGCGLCTQEVCPPDAISMHKKTPGDQEPIPIREGDWLAVRELARKSSQDYMKNKYLFDH